MYFGYNLGARVFSEVLGSIGILVAIGTSTLCTMSRWFSNNCFHPELREDCLVDEHISQMGWFNHQSGYVYIYAYIYLYIYIRIYKYIYVFALIYLNRHNLIIYIYYFYLFYPVLSSRPKTQTKALQSSTCMLQHLETWPYQAILSVQRDIPIPFRWDSQWCEAIYIYIYLNMYVHIISIYTYIYILYNLCLISCSFLWLGCHLKIFNVWLGMTRIHSQFFNRNTNSFSILKSSFLYSSASFPYPDALCMEYSLTIMQFCSYF